MLVEDNDQLDNISAYLMEPNCIEGSQMIAFIKSPHTDLHQYEELFMYIQEYCFSNLLEIPIESLFSRLHHLSLAGLRTRWPANVCGRVRHGQTFDQLEDAGTRNFISHEWYSRTIWRQLLGHLETPDVINKMSLGERHSRLYQFSLKDQFVDTDNYVETIKLMDTVRAKVRAKPASNVSTHLRMVVDYFKGRLSPGTIFSCPLAIADAARDGTFEKQDLSGIILWRAATPPEDDGMEPDWSSTAFFSPVSSPHLGMVQILPLHVSKSSAFTVSVRRHEVQSNTRGLELKQDSAATETWDLRALGDAAVFHQFMHNCFALTADCSGVKFKLKQGRRMILCAPVVEPVLPLGDDAPLADLVAHQAVVESNVLAQGVTTQRAISNFLSPDLERVIDMFIAKRCFSEQSKWIAWDPLGENAAYDKEFARFVSMGVLERRDDDFGESEYSLRVTSLILTNKFKLSGPKLQMIEPLSAGPLSKVCKLELHCEAFRKGFRQRASSDVDFLLRDGPLELTECALDMPKTFLEVIVHFRKVFDKPGNLEAVFFRGSESYYKCLLRLQDLTVANP
jgi:hypothetical protein